MTGPLLWIAYLILAAGVVWYTVASKRRARLRTDAALLAKALDELKPAQVSLEIGTAAEHWVGRGPDRRQRHMSVRTDRRKGQRRKK